MKKSPLLIVFLTVFLDLVGFGIVLPLLPIYSQKFGASGFMIGCIISSFSLMQFFFAQHWGRLSDRIGRRPVLLISTAGSALSYAGFAYGSSLSGQTALWVLLMSRAFAGLCGANITVAQACIADTSPPEKRSQRMGLIGMAFGLGFIFGPAIGGFSLDKLGHSGPGWIAAGFCAVNFLLALAILPETRQHGGKDASRRPPFKQWLHIMRHPQVGLLVVVFFLATFCFTCFETTLGLLLGRTFHLDPDRGADAKTISYLFAYCGIIGALVQGGAIGRMIKVMGEPSLVACSMLLTGLSLAPIPFLHQWPGLLVVLAALSIGSSLTRPPIFGLISRLTPSHEQGATLGVAQSMGSLARVLGPICAATLFDVRPAAPYLLCATIAVVAGVLAWVRLGRGTEDLLQSASPAH